MQEHGAPRGLQVPGSTWDECTAPSDTGWCKYRYQGAAGEDRTRTGTVLQPCFAGMEGMLLGTRGYVVRTQNEKEDR